MCDMRELLGAVGSVATNLLNAHVGAILNSNSLFCTCISLTLNCCGKYQFW